VSWRRFEVEVPERHVVCWCIVGQSEVTIDPDLSAESFGICLLLPRKGSSFFCRYILCEMSSRGSYPLHESRKSRGSYAAGWSGLIARRAHKAPIINRLCRIQTIWPFFSAVKTTQNGIFWALNGHRRIRCCCLPLTVAARLTVCLVGAQCKTLSAASGVACEGTCHLSRS